MRERLLHRIGGLITKHPLAIVLLAALLAACGAIYSSFALRLNADTDDLIGRDRPFMAGYRAFQAEFGDLEYIHVVVDARGDRAAAGAAVDRLVTLLQEIPGLPRVLGSITPQEQLRIATRAMPPEELAGLSLARDAFPAVLSGAGAGRMLVDAAGLLDGLATVGATLPRERQERMGASAVFLLGALAAARPDAHSRAEFAPFLEPPPPQYLTSDTGRMHFVSILPVKDYRTLAVIEEPLRHIRAVIERVRREFPALEIGLTGKPVLQADEMSTTNRDMAVAAAAAFALVALLFMALMGGPRRPLLAVAAFLCAVGWTQGLTTLLVGQLNLLSIVFILVLIGVGMDYGVHVIARYREFRHDFGVLGSIQAVMRTAVHGNLIGAATAAAVFFMALFTDFQGLRELGLIAGMGLLLCVTSMTLVLPALITLADRRRGVDRTPPREGPPRDPFRVLNHVIARPRLVVLVAAVATLLLVPLALGVRYEMNLLNLQAPGLESVQWQRRIAADSASATWFGVVAADTIEEVQGILEQARTRPAIGAARSVLDIIQPPDAQREALRASLHEAEAASGPPAEPLSGALVRRCLHSLERVRALAARREPQEAERLRPLADDLRALAGALEAEEGAGGERPLARRVEAAAAGLAQGLRLMLQGDRLGLREALPEAVAPQMVSPGGRFLVMLHPAADVWEFEPMRRFIEDLRHVSPQVTGVPVTHFESLLDMRGAFYRMAFLALVTVTAIIFADCRRPALTVLTLLPLLTGILWMVAIMGALSIPFSLANFFAVPILLGLSVDSSIHIMHRYREGGAHRLDLGATRRATILTWCTTAIGFGSLAFAHHQGLASLGQAMIIGSLSSMASVVVLLPALLAWRERRRAAAPPRCG